MARTCGRHGAETMVQTRVRWSRQCLESRDHSKAVRCLRRRQRSEFPLKAHYLVLSWCVQWSCSLALAMLRWVVKLSRTGMLSWPHHAAPRSPHRLPHYTHGVKAVSRRKVFLCMWDAVEWYHRQCKEADKSGWEQNLYVLFGFLTIDIYCEVQPLLQTNVFTLDVFTKKG